ncbi:hypothetical protein [Mammaliicoccus vitulinus]
MANFFYVFQNGIVYIDNMYFINSSNGPIMMSITIYRRLCLNDETIY